MGDYADMAVDEGIDEYWQPHDWEASDEEPSVRPSSFRRRDKSLKTCARCGQDGLFWNNTSAGWRLHDFDVDLELVIHVCDKQPKSASADDIESAVERILKIAEQRRDRELAKDVFDPVGVMLIHFIDAIRTEIKKAKDV